MAIDKGAAARERRYSYYVLQASAPVPGESGEFTGVLEDLSTGAKRPFRSRRLVCRSVSPRSS